MPTRVKSKYQRMVEVRRLYLTHPDGIMDDDLAKQFDVDRSSIVRLRLDMDGVIRVKHGYYTCVPSTEEVELAKAILVRHRSEKNRKLSSAEE